MASKPKMDRKYKGTSKRMRDFLMGDYLGHGEPEIKLDKYGVEFLPDAARTPRNRDLGPPNESARRAAQTNAISPPMDLGIAGDEFSGFHQTNELMESAKERAKNSRYLRGTRISPTENRPYGDTGNLSESPKKRQGKRRIDEIMETNKISPPLDEGIATPRGSFGARLDEKIEAGKRAVSGAVSGAVDSALASDYLGHKTIPEETNPDFVDLSGLAPRKKKSSANQLTDKQEAELAAKNEALGMTREDAKWAAKQDIKLKEAQKIVEEDRVEAEKTQEWFDGKNSNGVPLYGPGAVNTKKNPGNWSASTDDNDPDIPKEARTNTTKEAVEADVGTEEGDAKVEKHQAKKEDAINKKIAATPNARASIAGTAKRLYRANRKEYDRAIKEIGDRPKAVDWIEPKPYARMTKAEYEKTYGERPDDGTIEEFKGEHSKGVHSKTLLNLGLSLMESGGSSKYGETASDTMAALGKAGKEAVRFETALDEKESDRLEKSKDRHLKRSEGSMDRASRAQSTYDRVRSSRETDGQNQHRALIQRKWDQKQVIQDAQQNKYDQSHETAREMLKSDNEAVRIGILEKNAIRKDITERERNQFLAQAEAARIKRAERREKLNRDNQTNAVYNNTRAPWYNAKGGVPDVVINDANSRRTAKLPTLDKASPAELAQIVANLVTTQPSDKKGLEEAEKHLNAVSRNITRDGVWDGKLANMLGARWNFVDHKSRVAAAIKTHIENMKREAVKAANNERKKAAKEANTPSKVKSTRLHNPGSFGRGDGRG
jgi:hypothetical protein